ncbi:MAG: DEAD/DEAH box helicase [Planctomycetes bacterium]|jgi:ATP-dependent RNA helicase DeaD|nr:DEAD/DEAH box helicase [Planctomycetota bacterium]
MYFAEGSPEPAADLAATTPDVDVFASVPPSLQPALRRKGFSSLTAVQAAVLAADDGSRDLRLSSQTGSGKTVAIGIALARAVLPLAGNRPTTLVVAPTRELAAQVREELAWLFADFSGVRIGVVTGGTNITRERQLLHRGATILVGTPGRLLDHVRNGALDLSAVRQLVLDEADQMLDLGFKDELDAILAELPKERRTHLVSATFPQAVKALADRFQKNALLVAGTPIGQTHADIEHVALKVGAREHYAVLVNLLLLAGDQRTLVFVRTREDTSGLADKLAGDGFLALPIHGDLAQAQRTRTLQAFRRGSIHTLIATDVAARGLDITDVTTVVHFDPPIDAETYVHRSGRTGRAGQKGRSYMLVVKSRANFAQRLYREARVKERWEACPGAAEVRGVQLQRAGERAMAILANAAPDADQRAIAARLLEGRDAETVVAALLATAASGVREPFEVQMARDPVTTALLATPVAGAQVARAKAAAVAAEPAAAVEAAEAADAPAPAPAAPASRFAPRAPAAPAPAAHRASKAAAHAPAAPAHERRLSATQRGKPGSLPTWRRPDQPAPVNETGFVRFRINWGTRDGAEPRRVLAHVCRRGDIDGQLIGAIEVHPSMTTFAVAAGAAQQFERRASRPDRRDPHLVIARDRPSRK